MRLIEQNRAHNKSFGVTGFIFSQRSTAVAQMRYGKKQMWYNGCGIIAVYNALLLLGERPDFRNVTEYYEKHGKWFWGLLGTKPWRLTGFIKKSGFKAKLTRPKYADNGVYLITVWNKRPGMHFMALNKTDNGIQVYNGYHRRDTYDLYPDFDTFFKDTGIKCLMLLKII
ncbi:MAG: hypothetical protein IJR59_05875 [Firmicutes bacterium]|nr:hypothetical protein [Bacillota bacterium]